MASRSEASCGCGGEALRELASPQPHAETRQRWLDWARGMGDTVDSYPREIEPGDYCAVVTSLQRTRDTHRALLVSRRLTCAEQEQIERAGIERLSPRDSAHTSHDRFWSQVLRRRAERV